VSTSWADAAAGERRSAAARRAAAIRVAEAGLPLIETESSAAEVNRF
jgi:hypothetical protein